MVLNKSQVLTTTRHNGKAKKLTKNVKISKDVVETITPESTELDVNNISALCPDEKGDETETNKNEVETQKEERTVTSVKEDMKRRRIEELLAKERKAAEERERFVKEAAERKAAETEEIIKQAKRFILYKKPMCRRINQALLVSECFRELDAQLKFRETLKQVDKDEELAYVKQLKEDVAKYEEEMKQKAEQQLEKQRIYAAELKRQIEENRNAVETKEREEYEAAKQDQINMNKSLKDVKEFEAQQLEEKKQKLKKFFNDAIEEKKEYNLKLKYEDEFEDRANEIYRNAKLRIQKLHKSLRQKEQEEREKRSQAITEQFRSFLIKESTMEEEILKKALEEQEEQYQEQQRIKKERRTQMRKEINDFRLETMAMKARQSQEEREMKMWEMLQRFKKDECDKNREAEERKEEWERKNKYASLLKQTMTEKEAERKQEKLDADEATDVKKIIEIENRKVLDYAEEVINESKGVRPLYPILKAVEDCKKEMGLIPPRKREERIATEPKRKRRVLKCTKYVPEEKIHYL